MLLFLIMLMALNIYYLLTTATNLGPWKRGYEKTATVEFDVFLESNVRTATIRNFRRARYEPSGATKTVDWSVRKVDLNKLESVWYGISVFSAPGLAHTFLSFDFGDNDPIVISVEARMRPVVVN